MQQSFDQPERSTGNNPGRDPYDLSIMPRAFFATSHGCVNVPRRDLPFLRLRG
jgi:hypothetical protein